jgi:hypothetical protein
MVIFFADEKDDLRKEGGAAISDYSYLIFTIIGQYFDAVEPDGDGF